MMKLPKSSLFAIVLFSLQYTNFHLLKDVTSIKKFISSNFSMIGSILFDLDRLWLANL